ncbi:MAG: sigma-70 family RNA polymerase sigma factor [Solirubrobacteraceae bacterium]
MAQIPGAGDAHHSDRLQFIIVFRAPKSPRSSQSQLPTRADEDLMALVQGGDAQAFEIIFDRHADAAFSLAYRMCGRRGMAEDVVQDAFLSLWRSGARYDHRRGSVRSWVLKVVHNRAIDAFRRASVHTGRDVVDDGLTERMTASEDTGAEVQRREEAREVRSALDELPTEQRQVIELAYFGGFSHSQIADMLKLPAGTVKGRMRLGLDKMRNVLGDLAGATV